MREDDHECHMKDERYGLHALCSLRRSSYRLREMRFSSRSDLSSYATYPFAFSHVGKDRATTSTRRLLTLPAVIFNGH